jgi:hypothetical protein
MAETINPTTEGLVKDTSVTDNPITNTSVTSTPMIESSTIDTSMKDSSTIDSLVKDSSMIDPPTTDSFFNTPIVIMPILIILAGIFYGIAFAFDSSQIRFILYCGSIWSICLAFIYYVNQTPTQTLLSSSSAE